MHKAAARQGGKMEWYLWVVAAIVYLAFGFIALRIACRWMGPIPGTDFFVAAWLMWPVVFAALTISLTFSTVFYYPIRLAKKFKILRDEK